MTPSEIAAWAAQHGGAAGQPEGPDANGITVYRAADGSFINVRRDGSLAMRGTGPPGEPPATADGQTAPAPRGIGMTQQELEALLAQMGQLGPNDFREETKQEDIPNPASSVNGGLDPNAPTTIKGPVVYRTWVKPGTQQRLTVKVNSDGSYTQAFSGHDPSITAAQQGGTAAPPTTEDRGGVHYVWQPNPGGAAPGGRWVTVGPAPLTAAERTAQDATLPTQTASRETRGGKDYTVITLIPKPGQPGTPTIKVLGPDGQEVPGGLPAEPGKDTPSIVERGGKVYIRHTKVNADGSPGEIYHTDQAGNRVDLPAEGATPLPPGMPTLDTSSPEAAHQSYLAIFQWGVEQARAHPEQLEQIKATLAPIESMAKSVLDRAQQQLVNAQNTRTQDITARGQDVQDVNARRTFGGDVLKNALSIVSSASAQMLPGNGQTALNGLLGLLAVQDAYARAHGLMTPIAAPPSAAAAVIQGAAGQPGALPAAGTVDQAGIAAAEAQRQQQAGASAAPPGPLLPPRPPVNLPPSPPPTAGEPGGPPLQPGPVLGGPGPTPPLGQGQDLSTPPVHQPATIFSPIQGNPSAAAGVPPAPAPTPPSSYGQNQDMPTGYAQPPQGSVVINVGGMHGPATGLGSWLQPQGQPPAAAGLVAAAAQGPSPEHLLSQWNPHADGLMEDLGQITGMRQEELPSIMQGLGSVGVG